MLPPAGRKSSDAIDVDVESASESDSSQMSVDSDAVEMFPKVSAEEKEERRRDSRLMDSTNASGGIALTLPAALARLQPLPTLTSQLSNKQSPPTGNTSAAASASSAQSSRNNSAPARSASCEEALPSSSARPASSACGMTADKTEQSDGSYAAALKKSPPETIATASTA